MAELADCENRKDIYDDEQQQQDIHRAPESLDDPNNDHTQLPHSLDQREQAQQARKPHALNGLWHLGADEQQ